MKKAIVIVGTCFLFTFCNPSQQAGQTSADSISAGRGGDTTAKVGDETTGSNTPRDTTRNRPDSTR